MRTFLALLALTTAMSSYAGELTLDGGRVTLTLPASVAHHFTDELKRTVIVPVPGVAIQLRVGPPSEGSAQLPTPFDAAAFLRSSATLSKRAVITMPGTESLAYIEYTKHEQRDGHRVHERFGVLALRNHYIMFTVLVSEEFIPAEEVQKYLDQELWALLSRVKER